MDNWSKYQKRITYYDHSELQDELHRANRWYKLTRLNYDRNDGKVSDSIKQQMFRKATEIVLLKREMSNRRK